MTARLESEDLELRAVLPLESVAITRTETVHRCSFGDSSYTDVDHTTDRRGVGVENLDLRLWPKGGFVLQRSGRTLNPQRSVLEEFHVTEWAADEMYPTRSIDRVDTSERPVGGEPDRPSRIYDQRLRLAFGRSFSKRKRGRVLHTVAEREQAPFSGDVDRPQRAPSQLVNHTGSPGIGTLDYLVLVTRDPRERLQGVLVPDLDLRSQAAAQEKGLKDWETSSVHGSTTL